MFYIMSRFSNIDFHSKKLGKRCKWAWSQNPKMTQNPHFWPNLPILGFWYSLDGLKNLSKKCINMIPESSGTRYTSLDHIHSFVRNPAPYKTEDKWPRATSSFNSVSSSFVCHKTALHNDLLGYNVSKWVRLEPS